MCDDEDDFENSENFYEEDHEEAALVPLTPVAA